MHSANNYARGLCTSVPFIIIVLLSNWQHWCRAEWSVHRSGLCSEPGGGARQGGRVGGSQLPPAAQTQDGANSGQICRQHKTAA